MATPALGRLIRTRPWPVLVVSAIVAGVASIVRDLVHQQGTIGAGEGVAIVVTLAAGICAVWALVVITLNRRDHTR